MECFSEELISTADKAVHDIGALDLENLIRKVKAVAVRPAAVGILRATAHSEKQASGEQFQAFAAKVRGLTKDCNYVLPCPHATAQVCTTVPDCRGVNYTPEVIKDILLSGIYNLDVRRGVLGTAGIEDKTVNNLVHIVKAKEAARDAAGGNRLAETAAAAFSHKKSARQETISRPQPAQLKGGPSNGPRLKKARC